MDWTKCDLCQTVTKEKLQCPADSKRTDVGAGYLTLSNAIKCFSELGSFPIDVDISICQDENLLETFTKQKAKWHKSCRDKFSNLKLQRAQKRKSNDGEQEITKGALTLGRVWLQS